MKQTTTTHLEQREKTHYSAGLFTQTNNRPEATNFVTSDYSAFIAYPPPRSPLIPTPQTPKKTPQPTFTIQTTTSSTEEEKSYLNQTSSPLPTDEEPTQDSNSNFCDTLRKTITSCFY